MEIWKWELRKIANPGILAAVVLLGIVYYYMFPSFYVRYFRNGPNAEAEFALSAEWAAKYGVTMEPSEREELDGQLAGEKADFQEMLLAIAEASDAGITDYDSFCVYRDSYYDQTAAAGSVAVLSAPRPPQSGEVSAAPAGFPEVMCQGTDVSAFAARDFQAHVGHGEIDEV